MNDRLHSRSSAAVLGLTSMLILSGGTCKPELPENCSRFCGYLERCKLLPSPLGTTLDNCNDRCTLTDDAAASNILQASCSSLMNEPTAEMAGSGSDWCVTPSKCLELAGCLARTFPEAGVIGQGSVAVTLSAPNPLADSTSDAEPSICGPVDGGSLTSDLRASCRDVGAPEVSVVVRSWNDGLQAKPAGSCESVTQGVATFGPIAPGLVIPGVLLTGTLPEPEVDAADVDADSFDGGSGREPIRYCVYAWGTQLGRGAIVGAGEQSSRAVVTMPTRSEILQPDGVHVIACEGTPAACRDGKDNDDDGRTDCGDPKCTAFCGKEPPNLCEGGACVDAACPADADCPSDAPSLDVALDRSFEPSDSDDAPFDLGMESEVKPGDAEN